MKFFNIDQHVSVISDISYIFNKLGHQVDDWSLSGHHWVMGKIPANIVLKDGSKLLSGGVCIQETCDKFYETFKEQLNKYDGFIACYPAEFAMLYEKWNKPIIIVNCIRYEHPNSKYPHIWDRLNIFLKRYNETGKLFYVCNNKGDMWYIDFFTGIKGKWIPSLCEYTNQKYTGTIDRSIVHTRSHVESVDDITTRLDNLGRYSWPDIYRYKAFVHVPYHNGSMSIFEHYTANIPMLFPSKDFMRQLFHQGLALADLTFYRIYGMKEPEDPNNPLSLRNPEILNKWIDTCDFYDPDNMPHIQYFNNWGHLRQLLLELDLSKCHDISNSMMQFNIKRKEYVYESWKDILNKISNKI